MIRVWELAMVCGGQVRLSMEGLGFQSLGPRASGLRLKVLVNSKTLHEL